MKETQVDTPIKSDVWNVLAQTLLRDRKRPELISSVVNTFNAVPVASSAYTHDKISRSTQRLDYSGDSVITNTFIYNARSEVTGVNLNTVDYAFAYDNIGNHTTSTVNSASTTYTANSLNQYTSLLCSPAPLREPTYDLDGNMLTNGVFSFTYDAENRLTGAYSNSVCVVSNAYDYMNRRVLKVTPDATHTFIYDGWNLVQETIATASGVATNNYIWGKDLSGTMQGAGGVGGLLAARIDGDWYFPFYDNNGNITAYVDESGSVVAEYAYDAFGGTIFKSRSMADAFAHRFSSKYYDSETSLYYYGYRFYSPILHRWLNRDPIEEKGGLNVYGFVSNNPIAQIDSFGLSGCMARRESTCPVMVVVYLDVGRNAEFETSKIKGILTGMDAEKIKWQFIIGSMGGQSGKQTSKQYNGSLYRDVYFVKAESSGVVSKHSWPFGFGAEFEAVLFAARVKGNFEEHKALGSLSPQLSSYGADAAYYQIGGYLLAHEVLHSVGAKHYGDKTTVMTATPSWGWILEPPTVKPKTVNQVKRKLNVK